MQSEAHNRPSPALALAEQIGPGRASEFASWPSPTPRRYLQSPFRTGNDGPGVDLSSQLQLYTVAVCALMLEGPCFGPAV
jgi:hypothetical protein